MKILFDFKKAHLRKSEVMVNIFRYFYVFLICEWPVPLPYFSIIVFIFFIDL